MVSAVDERLSAVDEKLSSVEGKMFSLENRSSAFDERLSAVDKRSFAVEERLSAVEEKMSELENVESSSVSWSPPTTTDEEGSSKPERVLRSKVVIDKTSPKCEEVWASDSGASSKNRPSSIAPAATLIRGIAYEVVVLGPMVMKVKPRPIRT